MNKKARLLVVDDDPLVRRSCERVLGREYDVQLSENGQDGLTLLNAESFDLILLDLKLPDIDGMEVLRRAPDRFPDTPVIIITGYATVRSAVEAVKAGAFDYVSKPFAPDELEVAVHKALRQRRLLTRCRELQDTLADRYRVVHVIGESPPMKRVFSLVEQVAKTDSTVLVTGESGTGKELVARAIHCFSSRKEARLVAVDCGAIAPTLIASELFGHARGAFTGASVDRTGLIQTANGGTLFLDEISNLPLDFQASLLRVIEDQELRPVGVSDAVKVDVRYIVASNRDLHALVTEGKFREDLFYRLNVFPVHLPALRERREDIPPLARHFLAMFSAKLHKHIDDFTQEAMDVLIQYDWPGNVRELSNVVERLVILCNERRVGQMHLRESMVVSASGGKIPKTVAELNDAKKELRDRAVADIEKAFLLDALRRSDHNATKAAEQTGMQRSNFQALLKKHGLRITDIIERQR